MFDLISAAKRTNSFKNIKKNLGQHKKSRSQHSDSDIDSFRRCRTQSFTMGGCASRMSAEDTARIKASKEIEKALDEQFKIDEVQKSARLCATACTLFFWPRFLFS